MNPSDPLPPQSSTLEDIFGPPIFAYTRAQAIDDGVLIAVPERETRLAGFALPLAVSAGVYAFASAHELPARQSLLNQCMLAVLGRSEPDTDRIYFALSNPTGDQLRVALACGPGDQSEPVLTLCEPTEL